MARFITELDSNGPKYTLHFGGCIFSYRMLPYGNGGMKGNKKDLESQVDDEFRGELDDDDLADILEHVATIENMPDEDEILEALRELSEYENSISRPMNGEISVLDKVREALLMAFKEGLTLSQDHYDELSEQLNSVEYLADVAIALRFKRWGDGGVTNDIADEVIEEDALNYYRKNHK